MPWFVWLALGFGLGSWGALGTSYIRLQRDRRRSAEAALDRVHDYMSKL